MTKVCEICGKEFITTNDHRKYCGDECAHRAQLQKVKDFRDRNKAQKLSDGICDFCRKSFIFKGHGQHFCSAECRTKYYKPPTIHFVLGGPNGEVIDTTSIKKFVEEHSESFGSTRSAYVVLSNVKLGRHMGWELIRKYDENGKEWEIRKTSAETVNSGGRKKHKRQQIKKKCAFCGEEFIATSRNKKYCSAQCISRAYHKRDPRRLYTVVSPEGQKYAAYSMREFVYAHPEWFPNPSSAYATIMQQRKYKKWKLEDVADADQGTAAAHMVNSRTGGLEKVCPICERKFRTTRGDQIYCCHECQHKSAAMRQREKYRRDHEKQET